MKDDKLKKIFKKAPKDANIALFGATGAVGSQILEILMNEKGINKVIIVVRQSREEFKIDLSK